MLNIFAVQRVFPWVYTDVANANQPQRATCFEIELLLISSAVHPEFHQLSGEKFMFYDLTAMILTCMEDFTCGWYIVQ